MSTAVLFIIKLKGSFRWNIGNYHWVPAVILTFIKCAIRVFYTYIHGISYAGSVYAEGYSHRDRLIKL